MRKSLLVLCITFFASVTVAAQGEKTVFDSVEITITSVEPEYRLDHKVVSEGIAIYAWKSAESHLILLISTSASAERTRMGFESEHEETRVHGGYDVKVLDEKVPGLGDDNYMWVNTGGKLKKLAFRKGVYHVRVWSSTFEHAKSVAWNIVGLFPAA
jgi:hypothetical protein